MLAALDIQKDAPRYISAETACQRLGVDEETLLQLIRSGGVRVAIVGDTLLVEEDSLPIPIELPHPAAADIDPAPPDEPAEKAEEPAETADEAIAPPNSAPETEEPPSQNNHTELPINLPAYISLEEAARKYRWQPDELREMLKDGRIKGAMIDGELMVDEKTLPQRKEDLPEYKKYSHLAGNPIWVREAERRYEVPSPTLTTWVKSGFINVVGTDRNRRLLNEQDVAYCAEIYHRYRGKGTQGRRIFNPDGTPYRTKKTGELHQPPQIK